MAIVYEKLKNWKIPEVTQTYTQRDTILYALGLGFGSNPVDEDELRFVYEKNLAAVPTIGVVLAAPAGWINNPETGVNYVKVVHGEQSLQLHRPLPVS
ncbi:MAG TPA: 3-alpha,7-alpha,12-alpha-trihydroxy-5-beta-cholest-24-enoyl-CoA hydratase, partial [Burkholderiales bacterium]|nr:3-alpha,7-alpha,12-alpha-trihydroxy-5-beta-cholest-24-enoyl-CoA hydratase [Burkholderiales bacterium]